MGAKALKTVLSAILPCLLALYCGCAVAPHGAVENLTGEQATEIRDVIFSERGYSRQGDKRKIIISKCECVFDEMPVFVFYDGNTEYREENMFYIYLDLDRAVDGKRIFTIKQACEKGALSREEAYEILKLCNGNGEAVFDDKVEGLTEEQLSEIRQAYFETEIYENGISTGYKMERFSIDGYFGTYNGHIVFDWYDANFYYADMIDDVIIDGVYIMTYSHKQMPNVYISPDTENDGGSVLPLDKAYEKGYITKDNLYSIAEAVKKQKRGTL